MKATLRGLLAVPTTPYILSTLDDAELSSFGADFLLLIRSKFLRK